MTLNVIRILIAVFMYVQYMLGTLLIGLYNISLKYQRQTYEDDTNIHTVNTGLWQSRHGEGKKYAKIVLDTCPPWGR